MLQTMCVQGQTVSVILSIFIEITLREAVPLTKGSGGCRKGDQGALPGSELSGLGDLS